MSAENQESNEVQKPNNHTPFSDALAEALRIGVRKGRISREKVEILWSVLHNPKRREVQKYYTDHVAKTIDMLEECQQLVEKLYVTQTDPKALANDIPWSRQVDWLANQLPTLHQEVIRLLVQHPIPL